MAIFSEIAFFYSLVRLLQSWASKAGGHHVVLAPHSWVRRAVWGVPHRQDKNEREL